MRRPANGWSSGSRAPLPSRTATNCSLPFWKRAQDGIGDLAVHLDVAFAGKGEGVRGGSRGGGGEMGIMGIMGIMSVGGANRAGVAKQAAKDVAKEVG